jgi:DNA repair protein RecO
LPPVTDHALLLRRFAYGESSLVCHALTRGRGRVHLLAKGAYRPTSRYYAALDLFDTLEIEWSDVPGRELQVLQSARIEVRRHRIATDLERYRAALTVLELAALGAPERHDESVLFDLASRALDELAITASAARTSPARTLVVFELAFLHNLGLAPALEACASCGGPAPALDPSPEGASARAAFSAGAGGRLCRECAVQARAAGRRVGTLPVRTLAQAAALLAQTRGESTPVELQLEDLERVRELVARFLEYHLETRPKSYRPFLSQNSLSQNSSNQPSRNRPA